MEKYDDVMMKTAEIWAEKSKCIRKKVGAVIAKENNIISVGYNGTPKGYERYKEIKCDLCLGLGFLGPNKNNICPKCDGTGKIKLKSKYDCEDDIKVCPNCGFYNEIENEYCKNCNFDITKIKPELRTRHDLVIHAELNAILNAAELGHSTKDATLYVTMLPCSNCAIAIAQAGIRRVVYKDTYKDLKSIEIFKKLNIILEKI